MRRLSYQLPLVLLLLVLTAPLLAGIETYTFETPEQEQAYKNLTEELRCLVCQNQNIADSNAELAQDLRKKAYQQVKQGKSEDEVAEWMVDRYGDFVLYRPPVKATTLFLWVGPLLFLLIAFVVLWRIGRARRNQPPEADSVDEQSLEQARHMLENKES
ncbi:MAG TPA: cytochrome c-type biogenesis protein CcmH [Gammaproteobacteria bacterium]|nr:cytochrome c-type biogenesis protein CcmH [Gammaproteobacteria bacterium]